MLKGDSSVGDDGISQAMASEALPSLVLLLLLLSCNAAGASQSEASALLQWKSSLFRSEALHSWSLDPIVATNKTFQVHAVGLELHAMLREASSKLAYLTWVCKASLMV